MDRREWYAFLNDNKHLTNMEKALLARVCVKTIQRWKHRLGLYNPNNGWGSKQSYRPFKSYIPPDTTKPKVPIYTQPITDEWLNEMHEKGYGKRRISIMCGLGHFDLRKRFKNKGKEVLHQCCNRQWLEEHYETLGLNYRQCAEIACVNPYTIYNWLIKFGIPIKDTWDVFETSSVNATTKPKCDPIQKTS